MPNHPQKKFRFTPKYHQGQFVYLHAYADQNEQNSYFVCRALVIRPPNENSKLYKLIIVSVMPKSILAGDQPEKAKKLLGLKIARDERHLSHEIGSLMMQAYGKTPWLEMKPQQLEHLINKTKQEKHGNQQGQKTQEQAGQKA